MPVGNVGCDLNILTFGFLWDVILKAIAGSYFEKLPTGLAPYKALVLASVIILNFFFVLINLRISASLDKRPAGLSIRPFWLRFWAYFVGLLGVFIFVTLKIYAD